MLQFISSVELKFFNFIVIATRSICLNVELWSINQKLRKTIYGSGKVNPRYTFWLD